MIYFVTDNYLKSVAAINKNVDVNLVAPWIRTEAEIRLIPILGRAFYKYLLTKFNAQSLNDKEVELIELIQPCIAWRATAKAVYAVSRPLKNTGLQKLDSENSQGVGLEEVTFGVDHYDQVASNYQRALIDYLFENKGDFPELMAGNNKDSKIQKECKPEDIDDGLSDFAMVI